MQYALKSLGCLSANEPIPDGLHQKRSYRRHGTGTKASTMYILGLSFFYHDAAACLLKDGVIVAAAEEERFSRKKHDANFPERAIAFCLEEAGISINDVTYIVFYEKPFAAFERIIFTHFANWPRSFQQFRKALEIWFDKKLHIPRLIRTSLNYKNKIVFSNHHLSHAASAFFTSPFEDAAILTVDGVGEWATATISVGEGNKIRSIQEMRFPDSVGLFYSAITAYLGFEVNEGEYKVMGLAPYGTPRFTNVIREKLLTIFQDGSISINRTYFSYEYSDTMMPKGKWEKLFGFPMRQPGDPITQDHKDLAASAQRTLEEIIVSMARTARQVTGKKDVCLAGGVALNCVANSILRDRRIFEDIHVFPAAGDAGGAVGAAFLIWHDMLGNARTPKQLEHILWGPAFSDDDIGAYLKRASIPHIRLERSELLNRVSELLQEQKIIGWFQGRMEFGPRALGNRSILADPRNGEMRDRVNRLIKHREDFRPFAPAVLREQADKYFASRDESPFMLFTSQVIGGGLPAVTHIDGSARVQTVSRGTNDLFYELIGTFGNKTGTYVLLNTSFNVAGSPIVCTPQNAYQCFLQSGLDALVLGNFLILRDQIPCASKI